MTLKTYMNKHKNINEFVVVDDVYDVEVYFYHVDDEDVWDEATNLVASKLQVLEDNGEWVKVNLSSTIEQSTDELKKEGLFYHYDIDVIMDGIMDILAGGVSDTWMMKFAKALKPIKQ